MAMAVLGFVCQACDTQDAPDIAKPTGPLAVSVDVDASRVVRQIPRTLYGTNVEWFYDGNGLWDEKAKGLNIPVMAALKDLNVSMVRFPGGALTDYYHWRDGTGSQGARPTRPHGMDDGSSVNHFGTDELIAVCKLTGAEPLISVNLARGTPQEAADWVQYVERADPGATVWELGNEPYLNQKGSVNFDAAGYADKVNAFAAAMRGVDPKLRLIAAGGNNFGRYQFVKQADWDKTLLSKAGASIDYLAVHNSYAPVLIGGDGSGFYTTYRALFAFPTLVSQNFTDLDREIDQYAPARARPIRLAVTEWGPLFHVVPSSKWIDHPKTLGSAIFVARMLQTFVEEPRLEFANFFKLTEPSFLGWIGPHGERKVPYYAFQMFTQHFGSQLVATHTVSPTFSSAALGVVAAVKDAPFVTASSSLSADGSHLYIILVNASFADPANVSLSMKGFVPSPDAVEWQIAGGSPDANNGDDLLHIPGLNWAKQAESPAHPSFAAGRAGGVHPELVKVSNVSANMTVTAPPLSIVALEFVRAAAEHPSKPTRERGGK
jgi:alpha-N-arabinofuranosidase